MLAVSRIINSDFTNMPGKIDIVLCERALTFKVKWMDNLLRRGNKPFSFQLSTCDSEAIKLNTSTLLIFEKSEEFEEKAERINWQTSKYNRNRHLVYIEKGSKDDVTKAVHNHFWIDNVAFLVNETESSIELASSFMFTATTCREKQLVTINRFQRSTMKWENDKFFPKKYNDMHACSLTVAKASSQTFMDFSDRVMLEMSEDLNFRIKIKEATANQVDEIIKQNAVDFYKIHAGFIDEYFTHLFVDNEQGALLMPRGELMTAFEKFMLPFDLFTWILIFSTLLVIFISIQITGYVSRYYRDVIFGRRIGSPSMNLLNIFFCGGQTQVPDTSFARFVFLNIVLWSLIIRTCFQSLSYRALQLDLRYPSPETVDEMLESGFKRYSMSNRVISTIDCHR